MAPTALSVARCPASVSDNVKRRSLNAEPLEPAFLHLASGPGLCRTRYARPGGDPDRGRAGAAPKPRPAGERVVTVEVFSQAELDDEVDAACADDSDDE